MPLLEIENLVVEFETASGPFRAVDGVSLSVSEREVLTGAVDSSRYRELMAFQCGRAREHFAAARELPRALCRDARTAVRVMGGVYRRVLDRVAADPATAFRRRVELPRWQRAAAIASGLAGLPFAR